MKKILVVGSINMDLILSIDGLPQRGQTMMGRSVSRAFGGKGANQAVAAARQGAHVTFVGGVGRDAEGDMLVEGLEKEGIDTRHVYRFDQNTGLAPILLEPDGASTILVFAGANGCLRPQDADQWFDMDYDGVLMQLEIPFDVVKRVLYYAVSLHIPVCLDAGGDQNVDLSLLRGLTVLSPNERETQALCGVEVTDGESTLEACRKLDGLCGPEYVVLKLGEKGSYVYAAGKGRMCPAFAVQAADTTAAGDSFTAALMIEYLTGGDMFAAARYANAVGAVCSTRMGAQPSIPTAAETEAFLSRRDKTDSYGK